MAASQVTRPAELDHLLDEGTSLVARLAPVTGTIGDPAGGALGTSAHPLYFLHLARTGGSSVTRVLEDALPVSARCPHSFVDDFLAADPAELDRYGLFCGHLGLLPLVRLRKPVTVVTILRDPASRAWSHYRMLRWSLPATAQDWNDRRVTFDDLLEDPAYGTIARDFQARWLAIEPERDLRGPQWPGLALASPFGPGATGCDAASLGPAATGVLERCAVVGRTERLEATVEALARLLGRPLPPPTVVNRSRAADLPAATAAEVRRRSPVDCDLADAADLALTAQLRSLPPLPPPTAWPLAPRPFRLTMDEAFTGTGWHQRVHSGDVGWHRWSGPGTHSTVVLPVRAAGTRRLVLEVVASARADLLDGTRLTVQGRPVEAVASRTGPQRQLVATCDLDGDAAIELALDVPTTTLIDDEGAGVTSDERAGIALGGIRIV